MDRNVPFDVIRPAIDVVALRKESVDRNLIFPSFIKRCVMSLSARRAWIEISAGVDFAEDWLVALRKESVDRNWLVYIF